jgi:hypothetical protein
MLAAVLVFIGGRAHAQTPIFEGYVCQPADCLVIAKKTGTFTSGIIITGNWMIQIKNYYRTAISALDSVNCKLPVTIESVAYEAHDPQLGTGVLADSTGSQNGKVEIHGQEIAFLYGKKFFVNPSPEVPCQ